MLGSTVSNLRNAALNLIIFLLFSALLLNEVRAGENRWKLMGKIGNGNFFLYVDTDSIYYESENIFKIRAKKELSQEGMTERKRGFDGWVRKTEKESGVKVDDPEDFFKIMVKSEIDEYVLEIDCGKNELKIIPLKKFAINIANGSPILPNSAEENIKKEYCKGK